VLAVAAIVALHLRSRAGVPLAWACSVIGLADLLHNVALARSLAVAPHLGPQWYVVAFGVPAMLVFHATAFVILIKRRAAANA